MGELTPSEMMDNLKEAVIEEQRRDLIAERAYSEKLRKRVERLTKKCATLDNALAVERRTVEICSYYAGRDMGCTPDEAASQCRTDAKNELAQAEKKEG